MLLSFKGEPMTARETEIALWALEGAPFTDRASLERYLRHRRDAEQEEQNRTTQESFYQKPVSGPFRPVGPTVPPGEVHIHVGGKMVVKVINVGEEG